MCGDIVEEVLRVMFFCSTSTRHRMRHGIRHTAALAWRRFRPCVANGRLRHMLIGYARVSKADGGTVKLTGFLEVPLIDMPAKSLIFRPG